MVMISDYIHHNRTEIPLFSHPGSQLGVVNADNLFFSIYKCNAFALNRLIDGFKGVLYVSI